MQKSIKDTAITLIEERLNTYGNASPVPGKQWKELIHWSEKTVWHLYLYDNQGHEKNAITSGNFGTEQILAVTTTRTLISPPAAGKRA